MLTPGSKQANFLCKDTVNNRGTRSRVFFTQRKSIFDGDYIRLESLPNMNRLVQSEITKNLVRQLTCLLAYTEYHSH